MSKHDARHSFSALMRATLVALLLGLALCPAADAWQSRVVYVDADGGDDANDGSLGMPWQHLKFALDEAAQSQGGPSPIEKVMAQPSTTPYAPTGFGGSEPAGPFVLVDGVDVIGVRGGTKPVITVIETASQFVEGLGLVRGASNCTLQNFHIDGSGVLDPSQNGSKFAGIHASDVTGFTVRDCVIDFFHDGVCLHAGQGQTITASIDACTISDFEPIGDRHAGLWQVGAGTGFVTITDTDFMRSHDGVEIDPDDALGLTVTMDVVACRFERNENGLEVVGASGDITLNVSDTVFLRNHNREGGVPFDPVVSPAAIALRSGGPQTLIVRGTVRDCEFRHNSYGILWTTPPASNDESLLDMGLSAASPGRNNFCMDFGLFDPLDDPYRVCLYNRSTDTVHAVGNWWLRNNQGADWQGKTAIGLLSPDPPAFVNGFSFNPHTGDPIENGQGQLQTVPPGPQWGPVNPLTGQDFDRNFSIFENGTIDFGPTGLPAESPPDCSEDV